MIEKLESFIQRHDSFIIVTHDPADADGLGAEIVFSCILRKRKKKFHIINAGPLPKHFQFMDPREMIEQWDEDRHGALPEKSAVLLVDTADENNIGIMKEVILRSNEIFVIDHHDLRSSAAFAGIADPTASSTCELAVELAGAADVAVDRQAALAAYAGIAYDTGFFAYSKTGPRAFKAALSLIDAGVSPYDVYRRLCESSPIRALLLQKKAFASLAFHCRDRVASQVLRKEDFAETGAELNDTEGFVNIPLKSREIVVSIMLKEYKEGEVRCSLRSKGDINVAKISRSFGGGGHLNASGFKSTQNVDKTLAATLAKISEILDSNEK